MRTALMRRPVEQTARNVTRDKSLASPVGGWVTAVNIAEPKSKTARRLENWFPERKSLRLRGGATKRATISVTLAVQSIFSYEAGAIAKLFAATSGAIYNITSPASPTTIPAADISGQTSGYYSTAPFANAAGAVFLTVVNGTDARQVYDGAAWSTLPAITNVSSAALSHVWVFANRLFFVQGGTFNAWYLPVDNIGGAAAVLSLAGVFQHGGALLSGCTWSSDAGDGLNDRCVFISTLGEVVVYQGTDPSAAATWSKVGRYDLGVLLGKNALFRAGGDVLLGTADGLVPLSTAVQKDVAAISGDAISAAIETEWKYAAVNRGRTWTMVKWPEKNMLIVALPTTTGHAAFCFVANLETGAWAKYTGWDTNCICMFQQYAWFGTAAGTILQAETGGTDDGASYNCVYVGQFENWGFEGAEKVAQLMRTTFIAAKPFIPKISVITNYSETIPSQPSASSNTSASEWDVGLWDVGLWDAQGTVQTITTRWRSVSGQGFTMAPVVQVYCGNNFLPDAQLIANHVRFEVGDVVV